MGEPRHASTRARGHTVWSCKTSPSGWLYGREEILRPSMTQGAADVLGGLLLTMLIAAILVCVVWARGRVRRTRVKPVHSLHLDNLATSVVHKCLRRFGVPSSELPRGWSCAVCLGEPGSDCVQLPCGHAFHTQCIAAWFAQT